jgi:hypothetical protein
VKKKKKGGCSMSQNSPLDLLELSTGNSSLLSRMTRRVISSSIVPNRDNGSESIEKQSGDGRHFGLLDSMIWIKGLINQAEIIKNRVLGGDPH